jgi:CheY-like chemotaxis protein
VADVVLIHWKPEEAAPHAAALGKAGHDVRVLAPKGIPDLRALAGRPPGAIVVALGRLPSQGVSVATALRQRKATREVPLLFVEGDREKTARAKALLPDAAYTTWRGLPGALRKALAARPKGKPVVPGTMAGYSGTPLPKKLGIRPGSVVALLGAPEGFATSTLGPLPEGAVVRGDVRSPFDVGLLFVRSKAQLARRFPPALKAMGDPGALWVVWPKKTSGLQTGLGQKAVRAFGLARGLVDYKIAAIDATWSGLCFARRKASA